MLQERVKAWLAIDRRRQFLGLAALVFVLSWLLISTREGPRDEDPWKTATDSPTPRQGQGDADHIATQTTVFDNIGGVDKPPSSNPTRRTREPTPVRLSGDKQVKPEPGLSSKQLADRLLKEYWNLAKNSRGPIIIGGFGDSGTRGVRYVLESMGAELLQYPYATGFSGDSEVFMNTYHTFTSKGTLWLRNPKSLFETAIAKHHTLKYNASVMPFENWHAGRQWVALMITKTLQVVLQARNDQNLTLDPWGFKHPRAALILPFIHGALRDKFVFVHVIREGKDVIDADNPQFFKSVCPFYYGRPCANNRKERGQFWVDMNRDIFEYALASNMKAHQYIAIRTEDLVLGNFRCYQRLSHYLKVPPEALLGQYQYTMNQNLGIESSYFGNKFSPFHRADLGYAVKNRQPEIGKGMAFWGYNVDSYKLARDCESLEWMNLWRKAKGPLPGDGQISTGDTYLYEPEWLPSRMETEFNPDISRERQQFEDYGKGVGFGLMPEDPEDSVDIDDEDY